MNRVRRLNGTVIISHEILAAARPNQVKRAMAGLAGAEVHLVYSARDLARQIPAEWQEGIKHQRKQAFSGFLSKVQTARADQAEHVVLAGAEPARRAQPLEQGPAAGARAPGDRAAGGRAARPAVAALLPGVRHRPGLGAGGERPGERLDRRRRDHAAAPAQPPAAARRAALGGVPPAGPRAGRAPDAGAAPRHGQGDAAAGGVPVGRRGRRRVDRVGRRLRHRRDRRRRGPPPGAARGRPALGRTPTARAAPRWSTPRSTRSSRWPWRRRTGPTRTSRSPPGSAARPVGCGASDALRAGGLVLDRAPARPAAATPWSAWVERRPRGDARRPAGLDDARRRPARARPTAGPAAAGDARPGRRRLHGGSPTWCSAGPVRAAACAQQPLSWPAPARARAAFGAPPVDPADVPVDELVRVGVGALTELLLRRPADAPEPPTAARRRLLTRTPAFTLAGAPVTTSVVRRGWRRPATSRAAARPRVRAARRAASTSPSRRSGRRGCSAAPRCAGPASWSAGPAGASCRRRRTCPALARLWAERVGPERGARLLAAGRPGDGDPRRRPARSTSTRRRAGRCATRAGATCPRPPSTSSAGSTRCSTCGRRRRAARGRASGRWCADARRRPGTRHPLDRARAVPGLGRDAGRADRRGAARRRLPCARRSGPGRPPVRGRCPRARGSPTCWTSLLDACLRPGRAGATRKAEQR